MSKGFGVAPAYGAYGDSAWIAPLLACGSTAGGVACNGDGQTVVFAYDSDSQLTALEQCIVDVEQNTLSSFLTAQSGSAADACAQVKAAGPSEFTCGIQSICGDGAGTTTSSSSSTSSSTTSSSADSTTATSSTSSSNAQQTTSTTAPSAETTSSSTDAASTSTSSSSSASGTLSNTVASTSSTSGSDTAASTTGSSSTIAPSSLSSLTLPVPSTSSIGNTLIPISLNGSATTGTTFTTLPSAVSPSANETTVISTAICTHTSCEGSPTGSSTTPTFTGGSSRLADVPSKWKSGALVGLVILLPLSQALF